MEKRSGLPSMTLDKGGGKLDKSKQGKLALRSDRRMKDSPKSVSRCSLCNDLSAKTRNAILSLIIQLEKHNSKANPTGIKVHFNRTEMSILLNMCVELTSREMRDLTSDELKTFLCSTLDITNPYSLDGLCRAAMQMVKQVIGKKTISPTEFIILMSTLLRGNVTERAQLAFRVMDLDSDGLLRKNVELRRLLHDSFDVSVAAPNPEIDPEEPVRDTMNYLCEKIQCTITQPITMDKFVSVAINEPWITESLLPCLPSELTNIVFQNLFTTAMQLPSLEKAPQNDKASSEQ